MVALVRFVGRSWKVPERPANPVGYLARMLDRLFLRCRRVARTRRAGLRRPDRVALLGGPQPRPASGRERPGVLPIAVAAGAGVRNGQCV